MTGITVIEKIPVRISPVQFAAGAFVTQALIVFLQ